MLHALLHALLHSLVVRLHKPSDQFFRDKAFVPRFSAHGRILLQFNVRIYRRLTQGEQQPTAYTCARRRQIRLADPRPKRTQGRILFSIVGGLLSAKQQPYQVAAHAVVLLVDQHVRKELFVEDVAAAVHERIF
ncbi:hypothetical protein [Duganella sp. BuS-21]|uniref:hypothetical protein n=1 Tax=Duganella sp. BuS-21 TaxID=2943848 RepID=UPI0035A649D1